MYQWGACAGGVFLRWSGDISHTKAVGNAVEEVAVGVCVKMVSSNKEWREARCPRVKYTECVCNVPGTKE